MSKKRSGRGFTKTEQARGHAAAKEKKKAIQTERRKQVAPALADGTTKAALKRRFGTSYSTMERDEKAILENPEAYVNRNHPDAERILAFFKNHPKLTA